MFMQSMVMHQRCQPREVPTNKLGFQVGPYRMDNRRKARGAESQHTHRRDEELSVSISVPNSKKIQRGNRDKIYRSGANQPLRMSQTQPRVENLHGTSRSQNGNWHGADRICIDSALGQTHDGRMNQKQQDRLSNASSTQDGRNREKLSFTDVLQNGRRINRGSALQNYRRGHHKPRRAITQIRSKTFNRRIVGPDPGNSSSRQGEGSPQNIKIMRPLEQNGEEPITTYEVAGTSSMVETKGLLNGIKEMGGNQSGIGMCEAYARTSTLTRQPTGSAPIKEESKSTIDALGNPVDTVYGSRPLQSHNTTVEDNSTPYGAVLPGSVRISRDKAQDGSGAANSKEHKFSSLQIPGTEIVKMTQSNETVGLTEFAIVEQNNDSCLDLDVKHMDHHNALMKWTIVRDDQSTVRGKTANPPIKQVNAAQALYEQHIYKTQQEREHDQQFEWRSSSVNNTRYGLPKRVVGVTNIDFREAKQYRRQRSGIENPQHRVTYKLPSYASCLRAQIRPKNYTALREYYELLAKDEKLAKINEKYYLQDIMREDAPRSIQTQKTSQKRRSAQHNNLDRKALSVMENHRQRDHDSKMDSPLRIVQEKARSSGGGSQDSQNYKLSVRNQNSPGQTVEVSVPSDQKKLGSGSIKQGHQTVSRLLSESNQVTYGRPRKYQIAFNGPAKDCEKQKNPSLGTFVEEPHGSRYALSGLGDNYVIQQKHLQTIMQDDGKKQHAYSNNNLSFATKDGHRTCFTLNSSQKGNNIHKSQNPNSGNRFGLQKVTDQTLNKSSLLLVGSSKSKKHVDAQIIEAVEQPRGSTCDPTKTRRQNKNNLMEKADTIDKDLSDTIQDGRHTQLITSNESEINIMQLVQPTPDSSQPIYKKRVKTTHDLFKASRGLPYEQYQHSSSKKKNKNKRAANPINEDLMLLNQRQSQKGGESQDSQTMRNQKDLCSDKGIEIAMRTNDIFSSQQDDDELIDLQVIKNQANDDMASTMHGTQQFLMCAESALLGGDALVNESQVMTYRLNKNLDQSQSCTGTQNICTNPSEAAPIHATPIQQIFTSQGFSTVRNVNNSTSRSPGGDLNSMRQITQVEITRDSQGGQKRAFAYGNVNKITGVVNIAPSNAEVTNRTTGDKSGTSEVRRHQQKYQNFRRVHNRMMLESSGLHVVPSQKNEAQTQVQLMLAPVEAPAKTRNEFGGEYDTVRMYSHTNSGDKQQQQSSPEGLSVYQNSHAKILHHQHSNRMNINESEMLNLLDMYFGPGSGVPTTGRAGVSPNTVTMVQLAGTQDYVQQLQTKNLQLPNVRSRAASQMHPNGLYGSMRSAANRAVLQNQRRSILNKKYQKNKRGIQSVSQCSNIYRNKNTGTRKSTVEQPPTTATQSSIIPKNLLQGKGGKDSQAAFMNTNIQQSHAISYAKMISDSIEIAGAEVSNFFQVKQLKLVKPNDTDQTLESNNQMIEGRIENHLSPVADQNHANEGGIKVSNPTSLHLLPKKEQIEASLESLQKGFSTNSYMYEQTPLLKPQLDGKIDQVVIPSVPASASQLKLRYELERHSDCTVLEDQDNGFVVARVDRVHANGDCDTVPNSTASKNSKNAQLTMISKLAADHNARVMKHGTRIAHSSMQHSQDRSNRLTAGLRADSGQTYSTILKYDSPKGAGDPRKILKQATHEADLKRPSFKERDQTSTFDAADDRLVESLVDCSEAERVGQTEYNDPEIQQSVANPNHKLGAYMLSSHISSTEQDKDSAKFGTGVNAIIVHHNTVDGKMANEYQDNVQTTVAAMVEIKQSPQAMQDMYNGIDTSEGSMQLAGCTPDFLKALNIGTEALDDIILSAQPSYATFSKDITNNKDITAMMVVPNIGQQIRDTSLVLSSNDHQVILTAQTETRLSEGINGSSVNALNQLQEYGGSSVGKVPIDSSSARNLKHPVNVCIDQGLPKVTIGSKDSPRSSAFPSNYHQNAIYGSSKQTSAVNQMSQKINFKDCAGGGQEHAANLLQAYWPYLQRFTSSEATDMPTTPDPVSTQQRRPQTQQGTTTNHVPLKQYPIANGVPYQQHQRLASRKRNNSQTKAWKSGTRVGKNITSLGQEITPIQPNNGIQGKRFSQTGTNHSMNQTQTDEAVKCISSKGILVNQQARLKSISTAVQDVTTRHNSPSQKMIIVKQPERSSVHGHSASFLLPTNPDGISQEEQLHAIQSVLRSNLETNHAGSRVIGIVGDFTTLQQHQTAQDSRNEATKTMSINADMTEEGAQVQIHTFGDSHATYPSVSNQKAQALQISQDRHASELLQQFHEEDPSRQSIEEQRGNDLATNYQHSIEHRHNSEHKKIEMDVQLFDHDNPRHQKSNAGPENVQVSAVSDVQPGDGRNSSTEHHTFYDSTTQRDCQIRSRESPGPQGCSAKQKTSEYKTRFNWQVKENMVEDNHSHVGSSVISDGKNLEQSLNQQQTISILENQQDKVIGRKKKTRVAEAYISYAMRMSSREKHPKERLGHRCLVTQEQGTDTTVKVGSEVDRNSTLLDSLAINSEAMRESGQNLGRQSAPKIRDQKRIESNTSIRSSNVDLLAQTSSILSQFDKKELKDQGKTEFENPYQVTVKKALTKEVIQQRNKIEAAQKVQNVIENIANQSQNQFDGDNNPLVVQRTAAQKELAANISNIYSYKVKRPFNITALQAKTSKESTILGYQTRQIQKHAEKQFLQRQMAESFYSGSHAGKMQNLPHANDPYSFIPSGESPTRGTKPCEHSSIDSVNSSYNDHYVVQMANNSVNARNKNSSVISSGSESSLIIRGQIPSQTQHQSYLLNDSVVKFIAVHDQHDKRVATGGDNKPTMKDNGSTCTAQSSNQDLSRVSIKLVQAQCTQKPQKAEIQANSVVNHEQRHSSLQPTMITNQNQKIIHTSVIQQRNGLMNAQIVTTEFSAGKGSSRECQSPVYNADDPRALARLSGQHSLNQQLMDFKEGNNTIRAEENKLCFDQSEWHRISTAMKHDVDDDTSSCQQRTSGVGDDKELMQNSMQIIGLHVHSIVESKRDSTPADPNVSQIALNESIDKLSQQSYKRSTKEDKEEGLDYIPNELNKLSKQRHD